MRICVLGSAAGGGFPQWNSNASACRRARSGDVRARARTQSGLAVSADGKSWVLLNASPDLRQQIERSPFLHPHTGLRSSPIGAVVLTGGDVDVIAGLLNLRERQPWSLYATRTVHSIIDANPIFEVLARDVVRRETVALDTPAELTDPAGAAIGLTVELFAVPGKVPLYLETDRANSQIQSGDGTVGVVVRAERRCFYFIPGCADMSPSLAERLRDAELVFFDGTLWQDEEMITAGVGEKTGRRMGHMSVSGAEGTLRAFAALRVKRKILVHINNTNPILLADAPELLAVHSSGWEVAFDGMEINL